MNDTRVMTKGELQTIPPNNPPKEALTHTSQRPVADAFYGGDRICSAHSVPATPEADGATARGCARRSRGRRG